MATSANSSPVFIFTSYKGPPSNCNFSVILEPPRNRFFESYQISDSKVDGKHVNSLMALINSIVEILGVFIYFNISIFWRFVLWTISLITLPVRAVAALRREKQLQAQLSELQDRLDFLVWDRKELQEHIEVAIKEHELMEMMLCEVEDEHNEAIQKIKLLESALNDLKDENLRLKEVQGKSQWDTDAGCHDYDDQKHKSNIKDGFSPLKSHHYKDGLAFTMMHKNGNFDAHDYAKNDSGSFTQRIIDRSDYSVAVSQSLFSAMLSVVVGMVVWEAQEPCMPLVMALFMVVGMSLKSVVRFFATVKNKPALDAVALLSLNWFILGTLAYPTLPRVVHLSTPLFTEPLERISRGFGFDFKFDRTT